MLDLCLVAVLIAVPISTMLPFGRPEFLGRSR
jgi:hypothetical protein